MSEAVEPVVEWGIKKGVSTIDKHIQYYESFTYDGDEYFLYDSVYLYNEHEGSEKESHIGKLVRMWKCPDKKNKVKVVWFFRPEHVKEWSFEGLVVPGPHPDEIFLASGKEEVVAGKCNVVCRSTGVRNPQPSRKDLPENFYVFYRTFDVEKHEISDKIGDIIAWRKMKYFFNKDVQEPTMRPKPEAKEGNTTTSLEAKGAKLTETSASGDDKKPSWADWKDIEDEMCV